MISVLIVDDQEEILKGIRSGVAWEQISEIDHLYWALNAPEAKKIFKEQSIDLLITDIEMPGETGLELVSWVNAHYPQTACIVLTAHAKFAYAQDAVRLHCVDYILQPVQYQVLQLAVEKAITQILRDRELLEDQQLGSYWAAHRQELERETWKGFLAGGKDGMQELQEKLSSQDIHLPLGEGFGLCIVYRNPFQEGAAVWDLQAPLEETAEGLVAYLKPYSGYQCVFQKKENRRSLLFTTGLSKEETFDLLSAFLTAGEEKLSIYYDYGERLELLPELYANLEGFFQRVLIPKPGVFHQGEIEREQPGKLPSGRSWPSHFENKTTQFILESIQECVKQNTAKGTMNRATLSALQQDFLYSFQESLRRRGLSFAEIMGDEEVQRTFSLSLRSVTEFLDFAQVIFEKNKVLPSQSEKPEEDAISLAQAFITDHLSDSALTRQDIAQAAHVSESHLSHLFTKKLGLSITDYIGKERLKLAKSLLADTSMPASLIAFKSGFNSASYFTASFKKSEGMTPMEYRKMIKDSEH